MSVASPVPGAENDAGELREGWVAATLPLLFELNPRKPPSDALPPDAPVTFVPMAAVEAERGLIAVAGTKPFSDVRRVYTAFRNGDVIMAKITPCFENGKTAVAQELVNGYGFGSTEFHVFRATGAVLAEYLFYYLRQERFRETAAEFMNSTAGQARLPADYLERVVLPVPPVAEQRRIVARLEGLLAQLNAARERLAKVQAILKRFRQSVLAAAGSGRLTDDWREQHPRTPPAAELVGPLRQKHEAHGTGRRGNAAAPSEEAHNLDTSEVPESWIVSVLQWLCEPGRPITYGILKPGPDRPDGVPYVRVADFPKDTIILSEVRRTSPEIAQEYRRSTLRNGDVLLSIRGTFGRVCRVPKELHGANITQDTARLTIDASLNADYVALYLCCPSAQDRMKRAAKGVAVRGVNIGDVRALQIAVPPRDEQDEIVRRTDAFFQLADIIGRRVAAATARAEKLVQAILARAFRAELVPTEAELARQEGRDYEPASVLIERIARERTLAESNRPKRQAPAQVRSDGQMTPHQ